MSAYIILATLVDRYDVWNLLGRFLGIVYALSNNVLRKNGFEQIDRRSEEGLPDVLVWKISRI